MIDCLENKVQPKQIFLLQVVHLSVVHIMQAHHALALDWYTYVATIQILSDLFILPDWWLLYSRLFLTREKLLCFKASGLCLAGVHLLRINLTQESRQIMQQMHRHKAVPAVLKPKSHSLIDGNQSIVDKLDWLMNALPKRKFSSDHNMHLYYTFRIQ